MRCKNSRKLQTNFYSEKKFLFLPAILLSILAGGCTGNSYTSEQVWEKTKSTVQSAYVKAQRAVTNTLVTIGNYQRDHAYGQDDKVKTQITDAKNNRNPVPRPAETTLLDDRFPSRSPATAEENLRPSPDRQIAKEITQNEASKEMTLPLRTPMTFEELRQRIQEIEKEQIRSKNPAVRRRLAAELKELERMLLKYQTEEDIIEEMTQLRHRLRKLQGDLLKIQETNR